MTSCRVIGHGRLLLVDGKKMSKSEGTFLTARTSSIPRARGVKTWLRGWRRRASPEAGFRRLSSAMRCISAQYLQPMNFTFDLLAQAKANVERIQGRYDRLVEVAGEVPVSPEVEALIARNAHAFDEALEDNLNMSNALAAVFAFITELNQRTLSPGDARAGLAALEGMDGVLAVIDRTGPVRGLEQSRPGTAGLGPAASHRILAGGRRSIGRRAHRGAGGAPLCCQEGQGLRHRRPRPQGPRSARGDP